MGEIAVRVYAWCTMRSTAKEPAHVLCSVSVLTAEVDVEQSTLSCLVPIHIPDRDIRLRSYEVPSTKYVCGAMYPVILPAVRAVSHHVSLCKSGTVQNWAKNCPAECVCCWDSCQNYSPLAWYYRADDECSCVRCPCTAHVNRAACCFGVLPVSLF